MGLALAAAGCAEVADRSAERPDLILITIDTLRQDHLGCYGGSVDTPQIDRLAAGGLRFLDAFSPAPTTLPSHASLFTGTYPARHSARLNGRFRLPEQAVTLAESLQAQGYATGAFVGSAVLDGFYGLDQGFDVYDDAFDSSLGTAQEQRRADDVSAAAIAWLKRVRSPYFLWVHYFDPHGPYEPPAPFDERYYDGDPRSPEHDTMQGIPLVFYQKLEGITDVRYPLAQYMGEISYTDRAIGAVLDTIDAESALVVLTADHGESLGENRYWFDHGETLHDVCMRVPLLLRGPGIGAGTVAGPVSLVDLYPTILEILEVDAPGGVEGQSVAAHLTSGQIPERTLYFESFLPALSQRPPLFGLQTSEWKVVATSGGEAHLFHHPTDPSETDNVASQNASLLRELLSRIETYSRTEPLPAEPIEPDAQQLEKLKALGYVR